MLKTPWKSTKQNKFYQHYLSSFEEKRFNGDGNTQLRYICSKNISTADALLILGGRTEFIEKYLELYYDLRDLNVVIYSYDHRGQGLSDRILADPYKGHVQCFDDYVEDLKGFIDQVVSPNGHKRLLVLAHSMGGAVSTAFQMKYPGVVDGLIFSAPMFGINTMPLSPLTVERCSYGLVKLGFGDNYIFFKGGGNSWKIGFSGNRLTSSKKRFHCNLDWFARNPELAIGSPTFNWLYESLAADRKIGRDCDDTTLGKIPILLMQGEKDIVVTASAQNHFCKNVSSCRLEVIKGARHELFMEEDSMRNQVVGLTIDFLRKHSSA